MPGWIPLEDDEALELSSAMARIHDAIGLEERYGILVEAYKEYESVLFATAIDALVSPRKHWPEQRSRFGPIAQSIGNFLTAQKHYLDGVCGDVGRVCKRSGVKHVAKRKLEGHRQSNSCMEVIRELRDYAQHNRHFVHGMVLPARVFREGERKGDEQRVVPYLVVEKLAEDDAVARSAIKTLEAIGEKVVITPLIREFVECIGEWHGWVRETIADDIHEAGELVSQTVNRAQREFNDHFSYVQVVERLDTDESLTARASIFTDPVKHLEESQRRYPTLLPVKLRYISTFSEQAV